MNNKYNIDFSTEVFSRNIFRLINQFWKLIPMKENEENWEKQLETVIIEVVGLSEIFLDNPKFLQLLSKLEGLKIINLDFSLYRKTVFDCINLLQELKNEE